MYFHKRNKYALKELKDFNNVFDLVSDNSAVKTLFNTDEDCQLEISEIINEFYCNSIQIKVLSDKNTLKEKLNDYNEAYLLLSQRSDVRELNMHIYNNYCTIHFMLFALQ